MIADVAKTFARYAIGYRGHLGPSGPKLQIESEKTGLSVPGPKKSKTESEKIQNRQFFNYFDSFSTPFSTFWARGQEAPGTHFPTLFPTLGPEGPNDPCSRARESPKLMCICKLQGGRMEGSPSLLHMRQVAGGNAKLTC